MTLGVYEHASVAKRSGPGGLLVRPPLTGGFH